MKTRAITTLLLLLASSGSAMATATTLDPGPATTQDDGAKKGEEKETEKAKKKRLDAEAREAAKVLRTKLAKGDVAERRAALTDAAETDHATVIEAMAKALGDEDVGVQRTTMELLGRMRDPAAIKACMAHARSARKQLAKDDDTMVILLRSVGRQESPKAIDWLVNGAFDTDHGSIRRARLFGPARTRSADAIDAIIGEMTRTNSTRLRGGMRPARIALIWITGKDLGQTAEAWSSWWQKNSKTFAIPEQPPRLEESMEREWRNFWGEERIYERQKKRGDRG